MKKFAIIIMAILLVLPSAACGKGGKGPAPTATLPDKYEEKDRLPVSIALWDMQPAAEGSATAALSTTIAEKFGITLEPLAVTQADYKDKLNQALAAKALPDMFTMEAFADKAFLQSLLEQKALRDIPTSATRGLTAVDTVANRYRDEVSVDGKLYFLPRPDCYANYRSGSAQVIYYRADWGRLSGKAKVGAAADWQTFNELLAYFNHDDPDRNKLDDTYGLSTAGPGGMETVYLNTLGVRSFVLEGGQWIPGVVSQRAKQALQWANEACRSGLIDPESATQDEAAMIDKFCQGKVGMIVMDGTPAGSARLAAAWQVQSDVPLTKAVAVLPQPIGPYGVSYNDGASYATATAFSAAVDNKKLPRILHLIDWTLGEEGLTKLAAPTYRQKLGSWGALANLGTLAQDWMPDATEDSFEQLSLRTTTNYWWINNWRIELFTSHALDGALAAYDDSATREELVGLMFRSSDVETDWTAFTAKYTAAAADATQQANDLAKQRKITTEE